MDFGIARLADGAALTAPGDVVGTLAYMSPEQAEGQTAGPEADVYSLALTLYECWAGENPNRRATPAATARAIGGRPRPLRRLRPDLPRELSDTIDAALQPRPSRRPALDELGSAIEDSLEHLADDLPRVDAAVRAARSAPWPPPRCSAPGWRWATWPSYPRISRSAFYAASRVGSKASSRGSSAAPSARRCSRSSSPANWPRRWTPTRPPGWRGSTSPTSTRSTSRARTAPAWRATSARSSRSSRVTSWSTRAGAATTC